MGGHRNYLRRSFTICTLYLPLLAMDNSRRMLVGKCPGMNLFVDV
jgi:hypothetical protein